MTIERPKPGAMLGSPSTPFRDEAFKAAYPTLHDYLFKDRYVDGSVRVTSTLSIFNDGEALKLVINDRDNNRSAFFNVATLDALFTAAEAALKTGKAEWRSRAGRQLGGQQPTY